MELEFKKYCTISKSPKTVLPSPRRCVSRIDKKARRGRLGEYERVSVNGDFTEISFHRYRSVSCGSKQTRNFSLEGNELLKGSSVHQISSVVRKTRRARPKLERKKIELPRESGASPLFGIVDSLCSADEECFDMEPKRSSVVSANSNLTASFAKTQMKSCSQDYLDLTFQPVEEDDASSGAFLELVPVLNRQENQHNASIGRTQIEDPKLGCESTVSPIADCNHIKEQAPAMKLYKSLSSNISLPHSPVWSESESRASSPKTRFSPIRKMLDPFGKFKSRRSPLGSTTENGGQSADEIFQINRTKTFRKSLLQDFSNTAFQKECSSLINRRRQPYSNASHAPSHLHGLLKLQNKHGVPFFEFSLKFPEDAIVARMWTAENSFNCIYTFHCVQNRRKSSPTGWKLKEANKASSMVGQMHVSCYLCTKLKGTGASGTSMVREFVLYDIAHARRELAGKENYNYSPDVAKHPKGSNENLTRLISEVDEVSNELKVPASEGNYQYFSTSHPWPAAELHPNLEITAIVIQAPFERKESLKCKSEDRESSQAQPNLLDRSGVEQIRDGTLSCLRSATVDVVTPSGNHSSPDTEHTGASPLLDRWRRGGGCDCGGWDMACPLTVLGNSTVWNTEGPFPESQYPLKLFIRGRKEELPTLTLACTQEGHYAVDFHGQLSTLQAFSICVAVLHATESTTALGNESCKLLQHSNTPRASAEQDGTKYLINGVKVEEEKRKANGKVDEVQPSFVVDPPFSPIARA